jgi:hypothetical protein
MAALSSGFAKASVGHFGKAISMALGDPSVQGYYDEIGTDVKQALHDRWNRREFDNFKTQYLDPMTQKMQQTSELRKNVLNAINRGEILDPATGEVVGEIDPSSEDALLLKQNIELDAMEQFKGSVEAMMSQAAKFGHNPIIDGFMNQFFQRQTETIKEQFQPMVQTLGPMDKSNQDLMAAQAASARAAAKRNNMETRRMAKEGHDLEKQSIGQLINTMGGHREVLSYLTTTTAGRQKIEPFINAVRNSQAKKYADSQNPPLDVTVNKDQIETWLASKNDEILQMAAEQAIKSDPVAYRYMKNLGELDPDNNPMAARVAGIIEDEGPERLARALDKNEQRAFVQDAYENLLDQAATRAQDQKLNPKQLAKWIEHEGLPRYLADHFEDNSVTGPTKSAIRKQILKRLREGNYADMQAIAKRSAGAAVSRGVKSAAGAVKDFYSTPFEAASPYIEGLFNTGRKRSKKSLLEEKK